MQNKVLNEKAVNKKSALKGVWLILVAAAIFIFIIVKYAQNDNTNIGVSELPEKEDVYEIAKQFVADDTKASNLNFADAYSLGEQKDSVYIIKSTYQQRIDANESKTSSFSVVLRYKGGTADDKNSWELLNINKD